MSGHDLIHPAAAVLVFAALARAAAWMPHDQHPDQQLRVRLGLQAEFFNRIGGGLNGSMHKA